MIWQSNNPTYAAVKIDEHSAGSNQQPSSAISGQPASHHNEAAEQLFPAQPPQDCRHAPAPPEPTSGLASEHDKRLTAPSEGRIRRRSDQASGGVADVYDKKYVDVKHINGGDNSSSEAPIERLFHVNTAPTIDAEPASATDGCSPLGQLALILAQRCADFTAPGKRHATDEDRRQCQWRKFGYATPSTCVDETDHYSKLVITITIAETNPRSKCHYSHGCREPQHRFQPLMGHGQELQRSQVDETWGPERVEEKERKRGRSVTVGL